MNRRTQEDTRKTSAGILTVTGDSLISARAGISIATGNQPLCGVEHHGWVE